MTITITSINTGRVWTFPDHESAARFMQGRNRLFYKVEVGE